MKNIYLLLSASLFFASCGPTTVVQFGSYQSAPVEDVSYQSFYDQLSPYGNWINYPGYGYVWMPNAGPDFQPYATNGNWIYTNAGWTWASNYNWGWAPFHYGRWFYENGYGWMWVPGNEWAPAWVSWRGGGDYYGWAPMGPRISIDVAMSNYNPPANYWNFVPRRYMGDPGWHNYYVSGNRNVTIINNTTIINNYSGTDRARYAYAPGPDPNEVRRYSGNNFKPVQIRQASQPGERISGSQYEIYQPRVNNAPATRSDAPGRPTAAAPARYEAFNNVRPSANYPAYSQQSSNQAQTGSRPATPPAAQNPGYNPPANNPQPPANNRPSGYNPPANNPQPPVYNKLPEQHPAYNPPANNPTVTNPQPPANNRPAPQEPAPVPVIQPKPAQATQQANPSDPNRFMHKAPSSPEPAPASHGGKFQDPVNHPQNGARPATMHNPNNGHPVQKTTPPQGKPKTAVMPPKVKETPAN